MISKRRRFGVLGTVYVVLISGLLVGGSLWLDHGSPPVMATVRAKQERVVVESDPRGAWHRRYRIDVEFATAEGIAGATVTVPLERFDALQRGDSVRIRYLSAFPPLARLADRSTGQAIRGEGARLLTDTLLVPFALWLAGGLCALWLASRVATLAVLVAGLAWIATAFPLFFRATPPVRLASVETAARVEAVTLVSKSPARRGARRQGVGRGLSSVVRRLAVPYQVVQLRFAIPGRPDSVLAVDAVDSASVPGLAAGTMLAIRFDPAFPRDARLARGARTFMERNRYHYLVPVLGVGIVGMLGAWGARVRRARGQASATSNTPRRDTAMQSLIRTFATLLALLPTTGASVLMGQSTKGKAAPTPACALLSVAEVRQITGRKDYPDHVDGDPAGQGLGGGSSCQYGGATMVAEGPPLLSVVLIPRPKGKPYPEFQRTQKLGDGCRREDAKGIGDDALVQHCPNDRGPIAYVSVGKNDLLVQVDAKPSSDPAAKKTVLAIAKAAAANVK